MPSSRQVLVSATLASTATAAVLAWPAAGDVQPRTGMGEVELAALSQTVAVRAAVNAPAGVGGPLREVGERLRAVRSAAPSLPRAPGEQPVGGAPRVFNADQAGLPQNE